VLWLHAFFEQGKQTWDGCAQPLGRTGVSQQLLGFGTIEIATALVDQPASVKSDFQQDGVRHDAEDETWDAIGEKECETEPT